MSRYYELVLSFMILPLQPVGRDKGFRTTANKLLIFTVLHVVWMSECLIPSLDLEDALVSLVACVGVKNNGV